MAWVAFSTEPGEIPGMAILGDLLKVHRATVANPDDKPVLDTRRAPEAGIQLRVKPSTVRYEPGKVILTFVEPVEGEVAL